VSPDDCGEEPKVCRRRRTGTTGVVKGSNDPAKPQEANVYIGVGTLILIIILILILT
jgi:hypothetical protein